MITQAYAYHKIQNRKPVVELVGISPYWDRMLWFAKRYCLAAPPPAKLSTDLVKHELNIVPHGLNLKCLISVSRQMSWSQERSLSALQMHPLGLFSVGATQIHEIG